MEMMRYRGKAGQRSRIEQKEFRGCCVFYFSACNMTAFLRDLSGTMRTEPAQVAGLPGSRPKTPASGESSEGTGGSWAGMASAVAEGGLLSSSDSAMRSEITIGGAEMGVNGSML